MIVDAAMNDLIRPTFYEAHHEIVPVVLQQGVMHNGRYSRAGLRNGRHSALDREISEPSPGDLLAIMSAGAYGAVQAGTQLFLVPRSS